MTMPNPPLLSAHSQPVVGQRMIVVRRGPAFLVRDRSRDQGAHWVWAKERRDKRAHIAPRLGCGFSRAFSFSQQCFSLSGNVCRPYFFLLHRPFSHIGGANGPRE